MKIDISEEHLGLLCICAVRYCHGRETYMPALVRSIIRPLLPVISDKDLAVMIDDCAFQKRMCLFGDEKIDKPGWEAWECVLLNEKKRRENDE